MFLLKKTDCLRVPATSRTRGGLTPTTSRTGPANPARKPTLVLSPSCSCFYLICTRTLPSADNKPLNRGRLVDSMSNTVRPNVGKFASQYLHSIHLSILFRSPTITSHFAVLCCNANNENLSPLLCKLHLSRFIFIVFRSTPFSLMKLQYETSDKSEPTERSLNLISE